jgi:hypothetical protein
MIFAFLRKLKNAFSFQPYVINAGGTVVNQIHADLKSEKSERSGSDKEERRRELNFPDRQVTYPQINLPLLIGLSSDFGSEF